jgi:hypothetical protein
MQAAKYTTRTIQGKQAAHVRSMYPPGYRKTPQQQKKEGKKQRNQHF